ncbi:putative ammonium transporter 1 [Athalia rosae]|uniref:putative ammonium transporter 1 n=1 Tax=Athalia rosae TaxID=37344 RepID=UPI0020334FE2|nr:putative ammonium transporter 1 [Athalia rosae]
MSNSVRTESNVDNYYDYVLRDRSLFQRSENSTGKSLDPVSAAFFRITLTILLRVGFLLVQIGSFPVGNVNLILLQNVVDFCAVTVAHILLGFVVAFSGDIAGVIGEGIWIGDGKANLNEAMMGWGAAITSSAICTCCIAGRMHAIGYLITAILISGIIQPFLIHWAWTPQGWMADNYLTGRPVSFKDYAGGGIIHVVGGLSGFLGCMTLGRRLLRLRDIDDASLPADSPGNVFAGYFLIFLGLQGIGLPITSDNGVQSYVIVKNLLAASSSSLFIVVLHFALSREAFNYWTVIRCVQGAISGVVTVAPAVDLYSPLVVIGISCASGLIFYLVSRRVYRSALEDYCNIAATHLACALFGIFLAPMCGRPTESGVPNHEMVLDVAWQVICISALILLVTLVFGPFFLVLDLCGFLRNRSEFVNHLRATVALERGPPRSYMQRLFFPDVQSLYLQPGSVTKSGGQGPQIMSPRMWRYPQELAMLEQNRSKQSGGNNLPEIIAEDTGAPVLLANNRSEDSSTDPAILAKPKKPRQIHTLRTSSPAEVIEDAGGTGESSEIRKDGFRQTARLRQYLMQDIYSDVKLEPQTPSRGVIGDLTTRLHRTKKCSSLHSEEIEYCSEKQQVSHEIKHHSDFNVKVILEPRKKSYASSDSEEDCQRVEDNRVVGEHSEILGKTL